MSAIKKLLDFYINDLGLSLQGLSEYNSKQWKKLRTDNNLELTSNEIIALKEAVKRRLPVICIQPFGKDSRNEKLEAKVKKLKEKRKIRISHHMKESERLLSISHQNIIRMISNLKLMGSDLDICFCIDGTGSMSNLISNVSKCIVKVSELVSIGTGMKCRYALVIYRDYCDGDLRHQFWDFKTSADLEEALKSVVADGGGDTAEDCFGGLMISIDKLTWKANSKIICWMGDAPQHGIQYSSGYSDNHPIGDPEITSDKIFIGLKDKGITLVFCRLGKSTDLMMEQLKSEIAPYGSHMLITYNFEGEIERFLSKAISKASRLSNFGKSFGGPIKPHKIIDVDWDLSDEYWRAKEKCKIITFKPYDKDIKIGPLVDLLIDSADTVSKESVINYTINPVAKGEMRLAYKGIIMDQNNSQNQMILKESLFETKDPNKILKNQAEIQTVAVYLAEEFNRILKELNIDIQRIIEYIPVQLVKITTGAASGKFFALERYIQGKYIKFSNNNGSLSKHAFNHPLLQTFSHFTHHFSAGILLIADIQGVIQSDRYVLTDPAIHTIENLLPDPANLSTKGMDSFFSTHECNIYCKKLNLKPFKEINDESLVGDFKLVRSHSISILPEKLSKKDFIDLSRASTPRKIRK